MVDPYDSWLSVLLLVELSDSMDPPCAKPAEGTPPPPPPPLPPGLMLTPPDPLGTTGGSGAPNPTPPAIGFGCAIPCKNKRGGKNYWVDKCVSLASFHL